MCGSDVFMGMRLDTDGDAYEDGNEPVCGFGNFIESTDLIGCVDNDPADTSLHSLRELGDRLVVAVHFNPLRGEPSAFGDGKFAARAHIEAESVGGDPPCNRRRKQCLAGVVDVCTAAQPPESVGERITKVGRPRTEILFVEHIGWRAESRGDFGDRYARDNERSVVRPVYVAWPQAFLEYVDVVRGLQP